MLSSRDHGAELWRPISRSRTLPCLPPTSLARSRCSLRRGRVSEAGRREPGLSPGAARLSTSRAPSQRPLGRPYLHVASLSPSVSLCPMRRHRSLFPRGHCQAFPLDFSCPKNSLVRRPWTPGRPRHAGRAPPRGTRTRPYARGRPSRAGPRAELPGEPDPRGLPQGASEQQRLRKGLSGFFPAEPGKLCKLCLLHTA